MGFEQQVTVGLVFVSPYPAPELVKIRKPVTIGVVDEDRIGVGDVESAFNDRRGNQDVELAGDKVGHNIFEVPFIHLPVPISKGGFGDERFKLLLHQVNVIDSVVNEKSLAITAKLSQNSITNHFVVKAKHFGCHG